MDEIKVTDNMFQMLNELPFYSSKYNLDKFIKTLYRAKGQDDTPVKAGCKS